MAQRELTRVEQMEAARDRTISILLDRGVSDEVLTRISIELNEEIIAAARDELRRRENG